MRDVKLLSIVFSFRNEEAVLDELIRRVSTAVSSLQIDYEIIFVNDDSSDRSLDILQGHAARDTRIKILSMSRRFGIHPCVMAGLRYSSGDAVIYMDSDLQDPPELIPAMVAKFREGADVVNMTRTQRQGENAVKMWITRLAYKTINRLSDIVIPENTGDFKLMSRSVVEHVLSLNESDPFMRGLVYWVGFRQDTIYYVRDARFAGKTHFSLLGGGPFKEFIRGVTSFSVVPLYLSMLIGLASTAISFVMLVTILIQKMMGLNLPGWTAIMSAILFMGGTLHLCIGLIGIYIGKIHIQTRNRPLYILKSSVGKFTPPSC